MLKYYNKDTLYNVISCKIKKNGSVYSCNSVWTNKNSSKTKIWECKKNNMIGKFLIASYNDGFYITSDFNNYKKIKNNYLGNNLDIIKFNGNYYACDRKSHTDVTNSIDRIYDISIQGENADILRGDIYSKFDCVRRLKVVNGSVFLTGRHLETLKHGTFYSNNLVDWIPVVSSSEYLYLYEIVETDDYIIGSSYSNQIGVYRIKKKDLYIKDFEKTKDKMFTSNKSLLYWCMENYKNILFLTLASSGSTPDTKNYYSTNNGETWIEFYNGVSITKFIHSDELCFVSTSKGMKKLEVDPISLSEDKFNVTPDNTLSSYFLSDIKCIDNIFYYVIQNYNIYISNDFLKWDKYVSNSMSNKIYKL